MKILTVLLLFGILLLTCRQIYDPIPSTPDGEYLEIFTERRLYHISQAEIITMTAINISEFPLYKWSPSFFARLQHKEGANWQTIGPWYDITATVPRPHRIAPGDTISVLPIDCSEYIFKNAGSYRIVLDIYGDLGLKHLLVLDRRISNEFEIVF